MVSLITINNQIANADATAPPKWSGINGMKAIYTNIATALIERNIMVVDSLNALAQLSSSEARIVAVRDVAMYAFNSNGSATTTVNTRDQPAAGGGRWQYLCALGIPQFKATVGDNTATVFTIDHNLNCEFPTVLQFTTLNGYPYTPDATGTVSIVSVNRITVTYNTAPSTDQFTIVIKK